MTRQRADAARRRRDRPGRRPEQRRRAGPAAPARPRSWPWSRPTRTATAWSPCARAALAGGATWLGVAQLDEALALRAAGVGGRLLSWLHVPGDAFAGAIGPTSTCRSPRPGRWTRSRRGGARDRPHGPDPAQGRHRAVPQRLPAGRLARPGRGRRRRAGAEGSVEVVGVWSHLAWADAPQHPTVAPPARAVRRDGRRGRAGRGPGADPAPGQLRGDADRPVGALRPGPARARRLRPLPGPRPRRPRGVRAAPRR